MRMTLLHIYAYKKKINKTKSDFGFINTILRIYATVYLLCQENWIKIQKNFTDIIG